MSLSDLDYVNAAVSRSQQPPRAGSLASGTRSTAIEPVRRTNGDQGAALFDDDDKAPPSSSSRSGGGGGGVPSLAALLASLEAVTIDAQRLGVSSAPCTALDASDRSARRPLSDGGGGPSSSQLQAGQNGNDDDDEEEEEEQDGDLDPDSLRQLLAKLDETEGAADDLEGRLDGLIDNLDKLLGALGGGGAAPSSSIAGDDTATPSDE